MINGRPRDAITEKGAIDFARGTFTTAVGFGNGGEVLERRSTGAMLYTAERHVGSQAGLGPVRWVATPLEPRREPVLSQSNEFTDPRSVFRALAGLRAPVTRRGRVSIGGASASRYHVSTDLEAFLRPGGGRIEDASGYRRISASLDVWVDPRGRPLRVDATFTGSSPAGATTMSTVVSFTGYGSVVSVAAPTGAVVSSTAGAAPPNPLGAGPGSVLAHRLFFQPAPRG
jgi:hypothetical protein